MGVNLSKGQAVSLEKSDGGGLTSVSMGLGWKAAKKGGLLARLFSSDIDLDASAVMFRGQEVADTVWYQQLKSKDGAITHTGDNLTGGTGEVDDETILVDLTRVPAEVDQIVFTVNSFTGQTFADVENAFCRLVDRTSGDELARYTLAGGGAYTGQIMAKVSRVGGGWQMTAIGEPSQGRTIRDLLPGIAPHL